MDVLLHCSWLSLRQKRIRLLLISQSLEHGLNKNVIIKSNHFLRHIYYFITIIINIINAVGMFSLLSCIKKRVAAGA